MRLQPQYKKSRHTGVVYRSHRGEEADQEVSLASNSWEGTYHLVGDAFHTDQSPLVEDSLSVVNLCHMGDHTGQEVAAEVPSFYNHHNRADVETAP